MPKSASANYDALLDTSKGEASHTGAILLSDFGRPHEHASSDIQDNSSGSSDCEVTGWRHGAIVTTASASLVFLINLSATIWVGVELSKVVSNVHSTILLLHRGDCQNVERINNWVHFAINAVSAVLLSASNYCMQCLSAPTRKEINKAHASGKWLDIGVPSIRNLKAIGKRKLFFRWCLGLSSIPLHLL